MRNRSGLVWNVMIDDPQPGSLNMAIDEVLLHRKDNAPVLRLYQWTIPTLSLGMAQQVNRHVNVAYCRENGIPVVRRITGGKAVLHDREVTYCLCGPADQSPFCQNLMDTYCEIGNAFCHALKLLNVTAELASRRKTSPQCALSSCFANASPYEILVSGKKLLGSAQKRTRDRVLQHGSLLMEYNPDDWNDVLLKRHNGVEEQVTDIKTETMRDVSIDALRMAICEGFSIYFGVSFQATQLTEAEKVHAHGLARNTYCDLGAF
jgi:lipoyl(octanoyl) transferase